MTSVSEPERPSANVDQRPRPFLKWAGSKHSLLSHILQFIPEEFGTYHEPFLGAGSLFLRLQPERARLGDLSTEVVKVWQAIKQDAEQVIAKLPSPRPDREIFYRIRKTRSNAGAERAAEFIYLNKSCWNGLFRVNSKGEFNVPFGSNPNTEILDAENLRRCAKLLQPSGVTIACCDFAQCTQDAKAGDLIFFDPPYVTKHNFNGFRDYNEKLFSWADQERLAAEALRLKNLGARVIVTNAAHKDICDLYPKFGQYFFERSSTLAGNANFRGKVKEVVIYG
ncbi:Dam family site-specific DNA-(adenine-N6)-methyltransferase [Sphingomonas sp. RG327]|uniref:Site-specific DNA-methyltransferase (adenine-specific) n=1 Tax=Sphingomonas anseongensis TaxID=2908207 RepID=A0ABT0RCL7_9SPHN|nr:Dam family site-specific DNA-(adenine-N6)-methyltransferase [Sphingomonas anseongensis]MCL6677998.1 Dam family site-specific DNA-(adenine-N6)-methyltransferase [Sphingomonas anseongensis]